MEMVYQSLSCASSRLLPNPPPACSAATFSPPFYHSRVPHSAAYHSVHILSFNRLPREIYSPELVKSRNLRPLHASEVESSSSTSDAERWLLQPVGDGDSRHIGYKVPMPVAFEIASSSVTVGRVPEKASVVIPVATVSALHARIQKKEGSLLVTDLDSTNGTFIDDKRLRPGVVTAAPPGSLITFGDTHLAIFRVSKLVNAESNGEPDESDSAPVESGDSSSSSETNS